MLRPEAIVLTRSAEKSALIEGGSEMKTAWPTGSDPQREGAAELAPAALHQGDGPRDEPRGLERGGQ